MAPRAGLDREQVIATAARLADRDGLEALTLATLARELGVRTPSLYNHIAGLAALHQALGLRSVRQLQAQITGAALGLSGPSAVLAAAHAYRQFGLAHPGMYAASVRAPSTAPDAAELREVSAALLDALAAILGAQSLEPPQLIHLLRMFRSLVHGFVALESSGGFGLPVDLDASFEYMLALLLPALPGAS